ncbi:MAG: response regulator transcription factor [Chloroflexota bacterium]|nr:response regulator transcription factor [Chloroflexota bacterium]
MDKIKIILADDHSIVREGTRVLLEQELDMEVIGEASDGEEAVDMVTKLFPDVVLMDVAMPKLNGIEATRKIKSHFPSIAVLILTAYDNDQYIFALLDAGAAGYLLKNVSGNELINAIRAVYSGESVLHPTIAHKVFSRLISTNKSSVVMDRPHDLSEREMEILKLAASGISNTEIADQLYLSRRTVQSHLASIFRKMSVGSRTEAVLEALKKGWFTLEEITQEQL